MGTIVSKLFGVLGRRLRALAWRSRWFARRLWLISVAEGALLARRHWKRLDRDERERVVSLARKSRGRPSRLSNREARELRAMLDKLGHAEMAGGLVGLIVPFRVAERITAWYVHRRTGSD